MTLSGTDLEAVRTRLNRFLLFKKTGQGEICTTEMTMRSFVTIKQEYPLVLWLMMTSHYTILQHYRRKKTSVAAFALTMISFFLTSAFRLLRHAFREEKVTDFRVTHEHEWWKKYDLLN